MYTLSAFLIGLIGVALLWWAGIRWSDGRKLMETGSSAQGSVISISEKHRRESGVVYLPTIKFSTAEGNEYEFVGNARHVSPRVGDSVVVRYLAESPYDATVESEIYEGIWILALFGVTFAGAGFMGATQFARKRKYFAKIRSHGIAVDAKVVGVHPTETTVNNRPLGFVVKCQWTNATSGKIHLGVSEPLAFNPEASGHFKIGDSIRVFVDPKDHTHCWVDISHIENLAA